MDIKSKIREIKDFPKKGISFKDITTLLKDPEAYAYVINKMIDICIELGADLVVGPEARGFLTGAPVAYGMKKGFVPIRKAGKLPGDVERFEYEMEYGIGALEMHIDAIKPGQKVVLVDDLLATGGTAGSAIKLIEKMGGVVVGAVFIIELTFLSGREKLSGYEIRTLVKY